MIPATVRTCSTWRPLCRGKRYASGNFSTNELVPIPSVHPYELTCGAWFFQVVDADT